MFLNMAIASRDMEVRARTNTERPISLSMTVDTEDRMLLLNMRATPMLSTRLGLTLNIRS